MSGATGAGTSAGTSGTSGREKEGGGRGSAAQASGGAEADPRDAHTTQLKAIKADAQPASAGASVSEKRGKGAQRPAGGAGGNSRDTRGGSGVSGAQRGASGAQVGQQQTASPLPGERRPEQAAAPYHPPQAYGAEGGAVDGAGPDGAVRHPRTGARTAPRVRKARLRVSKADPWSVMKVSFLLSIALGICTIVASAVLWMVMDAMGVFSSVGSTISEATGSNESNGFDLQSFLSLPHVLMFSTVIAVIDVVLATALATLAAFIYNLSAGFVGGVELTLAEDE
ncbi:DUF3566 domain-containing protein [Streptomyces roseirectus]|uniref:DUF3566 domain-containing protein n=1 Tax=Streptomyces roseirectus TaxID=2768066 RepID=A0A7H0IFN7_9ACTN|nr:DUF3566 domain-containing protein [Streptomyces roseirectus]QNP71603.1 DUF3566 domain-containing protein [Streptomyces roseirectus]